jgi:hypothetical protein
LGADCGVLGGAYAKPGCNGRLPFDGRNDRRADRAASWTQDRCL